MPSGGARRGAGRKRKPNKASAERQAKVAASGITPLDAMIEAFRFIRGLAAAEQNRQPNPKTGQFDDQFPRPNAKLIRTCLLEAAAIAKDAAPYIHPRLSQTTLRGDSDQNAPPIKVEVEFV